VAKDYAEDLTLLHCGVMNGAWCLGYRELQTLEYDTKIHIVK